MFCVSNLSRQSKALGLLAAVAIPLGLLAYTGGFSPVKLPIDQPIAYVAQHDVSSFNLTSQTATLFRPEYNRQYWSGNLHAYSVNSTGQIDPSAERWTGGAASVLSGQHWDTGRNIGTMSSSGAGVAFRDSKLCATAGQTDCLPSPPAISGNAYTRADLVAFLRGDSRNEGGSGLRPRGGISLGDIVHSRPYYYDDARYATVFAGANDGMLHAFDAASGTERWAYVPSLLLSKLPTLAYNPLDSSNPYKHDYFVDGQINIATVASATGNIPVLVGSLGGGGKGLYALNISSLTAGSDADAGAKALWEISASGRKYKGAASSTSDYAHLGYTYGTPQLVKVKSGGNSIDAVLLGNGFDTSGYAYLYVIQAATGELIAALRAGSGTPATNSANGIFETQAIDNDGDGAIDRVYAADLNGNLWKFDLSAASPANWSAGTNPIFTTTGNLPVTSTLGVARHPNGGYMVVFGTGSALSGTYGSYDHSSNSWKTHGTGDLSTSSPTSYWVYGIWDASAASVVTDAKLVTQTLEERSYTSAATGTSRVRRASANSIDWSTKQGWKVALPAGERVLGEGSFIDSGRFYFNSYNPTVPPTLIAGTDTDIYGENWLMELNYLTGGSSSAPFLDLNADHLLDKNDRIPYTPADTKPSGSSTGDPIVSPNEKGIPVGKFMGTGVQSQPMLVELGLLNATLLNQNPDVVYPSISSSERGVAGGHFDVDYFYPPTALCSALTSVAGNIVGTANTRCSYSQHIHEYDDLYDKTGVNFLNPSSSAYLLSRAIPNSSTPFKVLVMNQYLNPAVQIHIGRTDYQPASAQGYTAIRDYQTASGLTLGSLPTYTRATIGSLALNMPVDAFRVKNWWGAANPNQDYRVGLMSTSPACVFYGKVIMSGTAAGSSTASAYADLYNPVIPDAGAGILGTSSGVRHNGAITLQIIKSSTPEAALELNLANHPEYGYRVKSAYFYTYVLAEYSMFWHHPSRVCFGDTSTVWYNGVTGGNGFSSGSSGPWNTPANMLGSGWTKAAKPDTQASTANETPAANSTDPKLGSLGASGNSGGAVSVSTTVSGAVTTTKITNADGSYTLVVSTMEKTKTTIVTTDYSAAGVVLATQTVVVANAGGSTSPPGGERGLSSRTGRISWRELTGQ